MGRVIDDPHSRFQRWNRWITGLHHRNAVARAFGKYPRSIKQQGEPMQRTNRRNRFIASVALTTAAVLGVVAVPGIASATPTSSVPAQHAAISAAQKPAQTSAPVTGTVT